MGRARDHYKNNSPIYIYIGLLGCIAIGINDLLIWLRLVSASTGVRTAVRSHWPALRQGLGMILQPAIKHRLSTHKAAARNNHRQFIICNKTAYLAI